MQEGREGDPRQAVDVARVDALGVEAAADEVDDLERPHHHDHRRDECEPAHAVVGRRGSGARDGAAVAMPETYAAGLNAPSTSEGAPRRALGQLG